MSNTITFVFAGAETKVTRAGHFFRLISLSAPVTVVARKGGKVIAEFTDLSAGERYESLDEKGALLAFDSLEITSASAQTVKLQVGYGRLTNDATTTTVAQGTTITDPAVVAVGAAAVLLVAAGSGRKSLRFLVDGSLPVVFGGAGVTFAAGAVKVSAGQMWVESEGADAAWYGISTGAVNVRVQVIA